jgi:molecular chaperone DnaK
MVYHSDDHHLVLAGIEKLNQATMKLAENMMNTAVGSALKGTKI